MNTKSLLRVSDLDVVVSLAEPHRTSTRMQSKVGVAMCEMIATRLSKKDKMLGAAFLR
jgi:hypothetical protein